MKVYKNDPRLTRAEMIRLARIKSMADPATGAMPSLREIADKFNLSMSSIYQFIEKIQKMGLIDDILLPTFKYNCNCGHEWISRKSSPPMRCPSCYARDWNKPRPDRPAAQLPPMLIRRVSREDSPARLGLSDAEISARIEAIRKARESRLRDGKPAPNGEIIAECLLD